MNREEGNVIRSARIAVPVLRAGFADREAMREMRLRVGDSSALLGLIAAVEMLGTESAPPLPPFLRSFATCNMCRGHWIIIESEVTDSVQHCMPTQMMCPDCDTPMSEFSTTVILPEHRNARTVKGETPRKI